MPDLETGYLELLVFENEPFRGDRVKMQGIGQFYAGHVQLIIDDMLQRRWTVNVEVVPAVQQAHAGYQSNEAKIVVPMQMGNKNMVDPALAYLVFRHLDLGTLTTIDQEIFLLGLKDLCRRVTPECRDCRVVP